MASSGAHEVASSSTSGIGAIMDSSRKYDGLLFFHHMIAGACAGTVEHTAMYPVDTIKTRMQALSHPGQRLHNATVRQALNSALKREGIAGLYKGVGAVAFGAGPAHAIHFSVYEFTKEVLGGNLSGGHHPAIAGVSGALATIVNEAIMTPVDVVKQRLQVTHSPYSGVVDCFRQILRNEGVGALFKSYRTTLIMNIPFQAVHFSIYEATKKIMLEPMFWANRFSAPAPSSQESRSTGRGPGIQEASGGGGGAGERSGSSDRAGQGASVTASAASVAELEEVEGTLDDNLATQLIAGGLAGGVAAALTTPLDVVKTRLQTEGVHSALKYNNSAVIPTLKRIVQEEGAASLWRGLRPRVLFHVPAAAVCWGTYETIKSFLASDSE